MPITSPGSRALPGSVDAADAPEAPKTSTDQAGMTTFADPQHGVRFVYPASWRPLVTGGLMAAPAFTKVAAPAEGTEAFLAQGTPYATTNLVGVSFSWTTRSGLSTDQCAALAKAAVQVQSTSQETINGLVYTKASSDAAVCHPRTSTLDTVAQSGTCFVFERDEQTLCPDIAAPGKNTPLTSVQQQTLQRALDVIMSSVQLR